MRASPLLWALGFCLVSLAACQSIWDIREAKLDPAFSNNGSSSGSSGTAEAGAGAGGKLTSPVKGGEAGDSDAAGAGGQSGAGQGGSTPSSGSGGQAGGATAGAGGVPEAPLCEQYCDAVMKNCQGDYAVYTDHTVCLAVCATFLPGEAGALTGNSVQCRLRAAKAAPIEIPYYCPIAGPGGNGTCGSDCEGYCRIMQSVCTADNSAYADEAACLAACKDIPDLDSYTVSLSANQHKGPHVQCRLYHVSASATNPDEHCWHAAGEPPCN
jgi:hypothetical protein